MKRNIALILIAGTLLFACTNDDGAGDQMDISTQVSHDITVVANTQAAIYQHDISRDSDVATSINLTETFGLNPGISYLQTTTNLLTFYTNAAESFDVLQKPILFNQAESFPDICEELDGETHFVARNSDSKIFIIGVGLSTTGDPGPELFVKFFDRVSRTCVRIPVGHGFLSSQRGVAVIDEMLYLAYQDFTSSEYVLAQIDLDSEQRLGDLRFDQPWTVAINAGMEIHFFLEDDGYEIYDAVSYDLISSSSLEDNAVLGGEGILETNFWDNGIVVIISYQQPSIISLGPAVLDLQTGNLKQGDDTFLFDVRDVLNQALGYDIFFTTYEVNLRTGAVVAGFARSGREEGGIVYTNFEGDILKVTEFVGIPGPIVLR